jgi:hypothetical protein
MENLNLIRSSIKDIEDFILDSSFKQNKKELLFETGEYGMLLFHRKITYEVENQGFIIYSEVDEKLEIPQNKYVKYLCISGITIIILYNKELDNRLNAEIDDETGYPVKSSTLYLKEN